jgi:molybdenum cofactor synthesis domain-containing protein
MRLIESVITPVERAEMLPVDDALGRVLAADVAATRSAPPFDRATMDGYAVIRDDLGGVGPYTTLSVVEDVFAGSIAKKRLAPGEAMQIATGAPIPEGADTVVMVEDTKRAGRLVEIFKYPSKGDNITLEASDIREGEIILKAGAVLDPAKVGMLASQGLSQVSVYVKPIVAIMPTGEEIVAVGERLSGGQIYDINSHTLAAVVRMNGGNPLVLPITGDEMTSLKSRLEEALAADIVVISGGSSVGEKDFLLDLLESMGDVRFHGVKLKPGKPTAFAVVKGKPVMGMPGYPTSCLINAYLLLAPALRKMSRLNSAKGKAIAAVLGERVRGTAGRVMFLPIRIEGGKAYSAFKDSGAITSIGRADGYMVIAANGELPAGADIEMIPF